MPTDPPACLIVRAARRLLALPVGEVIEVMRPRPVAPLAGVPPYVRGLAVVRGEAVPVLELGLLLGARPDDGARAPEDGPDPEAAGCRFVTLRCGARRVAAAVDAVVGVRPAPPGWAALPPLARDAGPALAAVGQLDGELAVALAAGRLVPEGALAAWAEGVGAGA